MKKRNINIKEPTRYFLIVVGTICVLLGVIGIVIPVLPTTPFLLLAAILYARSSKRFYHWLMTNPLCGDYLRNYKEGKGIPIKQKAITLILLWLSISYAIWFVITIWWIDLILFGIAVGVTVHIVRIRTKK